MTTERIGIIDLGSNSSRLVIYEIYPDGAYQSVFEMKQNLQLGRNMGKNRRISEQGIARAVTCSKLFARAGKLHGVTRWFPVATAAVRQASNQQEVLQLLEDETGFRFQVLNEREEGRYGYLGVINTMNIENALLFDIGGASTELMLVKNRCLVEVKSLPFGSLNLTEQISSVPDADRGDVAKSFMMELFTAIPWLTSTSTSDLTLVGLGGTARAVAKLHRAESATRLERIHGYPIEAGYVREVFASFKNMSAEKRRKIKGLSKNRAHILVAGMAAIAALIEVTEASKIVVSRSGLREGLFYEYLLRREGLEQVDSVLSHSVHNLQKLFHVNQPISTMVTRAALALFDALAPVHQMTGHERQLLSVTAEIEGIGYYINTEKSNRHSAYLTLNSHLYGLTFGEMKDVADLLEGRGSADLRKLLILIRLAKLLTLQLGIDPEEVHCTLRQNRFEVGRVKGIRETVHSSADSDLEQDFKKGFGIELAYVED